ncbi:MAG: hypothetical protein AB2L12_17525 [Smithellaceae bacterium]
MAKTYFDHKEFKKGELNNILKNEAGRLREIQRQEQQSGVTTSKDDDIYFTKKGEN